MPITERFLQKKWVCLEGWVEKGELLPTQRLWSWFPGLAGLLLHHFPLISQGSNLGSAVTTVDWVSSLNKKSFPSLFPNFCGICKKPTGTHNYLLWEQFLGAILLHFQSHSYPSTTTHRVHTVTQQQRLLNILNHWFLPPGFGCWKREMWPHWLSWQGPESPYVLLYVNTYHKSPHYSCAAN